MMMDNALADQPHCSHYQVPRIADGEAVRRQGDADLGGYGLTAEYRISRYRSYADMFFTGEGSANVPKIVVAEDALGNEWQTFAAARPVCTTSARTTSPTK